MSFGPNENFVDNRICNFLLLAQKEVEYSNFCPILSYSDELGNLNVKFPITSIEQMLI